MFLYLDCTSCNRVSIGYLRMYELAFLIIYTSCYYDLFISLLYCICMYATMLALSVSCFVPINSLLFVPLSSIFMSIVYQLVSSHSL